MKELRAEWESREYMIVTCWIMFLKEKQEFRNTRKNKYEKAHCKEVAWWKNVGSLA